MLKEVRKRMVEFHMVSPGDKILVGVSGGADSVALLLCLYALREEMKIFLEVVHVEHGIRGEESREDAKFVEALCQRLQVPYQMHSVDVPAYAADNGLGLEEAARILRYEIFEKQALEQGAKVALAHHQEDNAETILFQMIRGSFLTGLCGMQPVRMTEEGVCYIRPLLSLHREELEDFLKAHGMPWRVDSTNMELDYSRNFLRAEILPRLTQVNAQAIEHMNQSAGYLSEMKAYLDEETERLWNQMATVAGEISLETKALLELPLILQRQMMYKAMVLLAKGKKDITSTHVEELLTLSKGQSGKRTSLPYQIVAWKEFDKLYLAKAGDVSFQKTDCEEVYEVTEAMLEELRENDREVSFSIGSRNEQISCRVFEKKVESLEIPRKTYTKWFDYDKIKRGFCIRTRRSGDYFISDASGHRKKLKSYFIEEKIPVRERELRWLLAMDSEVLWLIGGRISEHIKVSQKTKYILEVTYNGGNENE